MPSKVTNKNVKKSDSKFHKINKRGGCCNVRSPGPVYGLKPVVGYADHCHTKWREPAYSIGLALHSKQKCGGPGPSPLVYKNCQDGFTFPKAVHTTRIPCSPGPEYTLPEFSSPAFSIVPRRKGPCIPSTSGPYDPPKLPTGPAYHIVGRPKDIACKPSPPMYNVGPVCLIYKCGPSFSIIPRRPVKSGCGGPGPQYLPKEQKCCEKGFTMGVKHSECSGIPRTENDE